MSVLQIVSAIALLVGGTVIFCVGLALAARVVDRLWDFLSPADGSDAPPARPRSGAARARVRVGASTSRPLLVTVLAAGLVGALAWLAFTVSRVGDRLG